MMVWAFIGGCVFGGLFTVLAFALGITAGRNDRQ